MKRLALIIAALLLSGAAYAADLPAQPKTAAPIGYPAANTNGFYLDVGTFASMSSSSVNTGVESVNLNSTGAALEGGIGYQYRIPGDWAFTEFSTNWTNLGSSTTCNAMPGLTSCSVKGAWGFGLEQGFGFNWAYPLSLIPAFSNLFGGSSPASLLPNGVTPTSSVPYVSVRANFDQVTGTINGVGSASAWQVSPEVRLGLINYLPAGGGVLKTYVGYEFGDASVGISGVGSVKPGNTLKAGLSYAF
jgi:hypothetical protein